MDWPPIRPDTGRSPEDLGLRLRHTPMPNDPTQVEIITGRERRRRYSAEHKLGLVEETMQPGMTVSAVARLQGVSPSLLFGWRRRMSEGGRTAIQADDDVVAAGGCASWRAASTISSACWDSRPWRWRSCGRH